MPSDEAPAQPESEIPFGDVEPIEVTDDMVYAFHNRLSDGSLTSDEFTDIKQGLCAALMNIPLPTQPVIPERLIQAINRLLDNDGSRGCFDALEQHRAKTELELLLAAAQQNEPQNIPENIPEQPVSEPYKLISVKDDTPTESGDYWCYLGKDFESSTKYRVVHFDVRHHEFQDHRVTHWMRLPAEPEQEA